MATNNSGFDAAAITGILAKILAAKDVKDYRGALAAAAGKGVAADEVDAIFAKANFTNDVVAPAVIKTVRYVLVLGTEWKKVEDAAKKAVETAKASDRIMRGNWTSLANAIAKRRIEDGMKPDAAEKAAIAAAETKGRGEAAKAVTARAAKMLREIEGDLSAAIEDEKLRAKVAGTLLMLEKFAAA